MSLGIMLPDHPKWSEFSARLEGPEGCNFRRSDPSNPDTTKWDCKGGTNMDLAEKILALMGATPEDIQASVKVFAAHGGFCDCEILLNVEASWRPSTHHRRRRRTNAPA